MATTNTEVGLQWFSCMFGRLIVLMIGFTTAGGTAPGQINLEKADQAVKQIIDGSKAPKDYRVIESDSDDVRLGKQRINAYYTAYSYNKKAVDFGMNEPMSLIPAFQRLTQARLEFHQDSTKQKEILLERFLFAKEMERFLAGRETAGLNEPGKFADWVAIRMGMELKVLKWKDEIDPKLLLPNPVVDRLIEQSAASKSYPINDSDSVATQLKKKRIICLYEALKPAKASLEVGRYDDVSVLAPIQSRLVAAELDLYTERDKQIEVVARNASLARSMESKLAKRAKFLAQEKLFDCAAYRISADLKYLRLAKDQASDPTTSPIIAELTDIKRVPKPYQWRDSDDTQKKLMKQEIFCMLKVNELLNNDVGGTFSDEPLIERLTQHSKAKLAFHSSAKARLDIITQQLEHALEWEQLLVKRQAIDDRDRLPIWVAYRKGVELALLVEKRKK